MGLDVAKTKLVVICSAPKTSWEFSQEVQAQIPENSICHNKTLMSLNTLLYGYCRWAEPAEEETSLSVYIYARRENEHHQRCVSFWNLTAPAVWSRAWWTSSHSPTPTVRSNYIEHVCSECRTNTNYSVTVSYASEVENIGCSVACTNAGWCQCSLCRWVAIVQHRTETCLSKVLHKVQGKVPKLSTRGKTWTESVVGINAGLGRQQLQVNFNKFLSTHFWT